VLTIIDWQIMDFTKPNDGWRDLQKSKFRMAKGDEQLDILFDGPLPHHVTEVFSEVTYFVYMARRTPKQLLMRYVRARYEPGEYPATMARMYSWTPDECIPEFFTDPSIFMSRHPDMPNLAVPDWASSPEEFIRMHMDALESDYISSRLHSWIDLTFGFRMTGQAAAQSKNVYLGLIDNHTHPISNGPVQLFQHPHPPRFPGDCPVPPSNASRSIARSVVAGRASEQASFLSARSKDTPALDIASTTLQQTASAGSGRVAVEPPIEALVSRSAFVTDKQLSQSRIDLPASVLPRTLTQSLVHEETISRFLANALESWTAAIPIQAPSITSPSPSASSPQLQTSSASLMVAVPPPATATPFANAAPSSSADSSIGDISTPSVLSERLQACGRDFVHVARLMICMLAGSPYARVAPALLARAPPPMREGLQLLLRPGAETRFVVDRLRGLFMCSYSLGPVIRMPGYFPRLWSTLGRLTQARPIERVSVLEEDLEGLLEMNDEGLQLLLPHVKPLFTNALSGRQIDWLVAAAAAPMIPRLAKRLGQNQSVALFLRPILVCLEKYSVPTVPAAFMQPDVIGPLPGLFGLREFMDAFSGPLSECLVCENVLVSEAAARAVQRLLSTLGVVCCGRHFVKPFLRAMVNSPLHVSVRLLDDFVRLERSKYEEYVGSHNSSVACGLSASAPPAVCAPVFDVMCTMQSVLGDHLLFDAYLPFIVQQVSLHVTKATSRAANVVGNCLLLLSSVVSLPITRWSAVHDKVELIIRAVIDPVVQNLTTMVDGMGIDVASRRTVATRVMTLILVLVKNLGREEMTRRMEGILDQFFSVFQQLHGDGVGSVASVDIHGRTSSFSNMQPGRPDVLSPIRGVEESLLAHSALAGVLTADFAAHTYALCCQVGNSCCRCCCCSCCSCCSCCCCCCCPSSSSSCHGHHHHM
jgi:hypothetical protein